MSLSGSIAMISAFAMPWFGVRMGNQGVVLSGQFLAGFLAGATDLRQYMPGAAGGPNEVLMLRILVLFFPTFGAVAALLVSASIFRHTSTALALLVTLAGVIPLIVLAAGITCLPPNSSVEIGLWVIGAGAILVLIGVPVHVRLSRRPF